MTYELTYSRQAAGYLRRLDRPTQLRMRAAIDALRDEPRPHGTKQLKYAGGSRSLRVGDWRIVYFIEDDARTVNIEIVAPRGQVYRRL